MASDRTILVFGDSLSAAYGIRPEQGWVALLAQRLRDQGYGYQVINASVSGETSTGGLERLPRALQLHTPEIVILELGANDGLRGLPVTDLRASLARMVQLSQAAGARVLLVGIRIPPNYGPRYTEEFARVFPELAQQYHLPVICTYTNIVEAGALMSYAFDLKAGNRRIAAQIVEILNGGKPAEMPYFSEAHFELVINLKAAKELGLDIPAVLVAQADKIIE